MIDIRPIALCILAAPILGGCSSEASAQPEGSAQQPAASVEAAPSWPPSEDAVRANIRAAFERLEAGAHEEHVRSNFAPDATFVIHGDPELAGNYSGHEAIIAGLDELFQSVPVHAFTLHEMWVTIGSSEVTAAVAWSDAAQLPSGQPLPTQGMNRLRVGPGGLIEEHLFIAPDEGWPGAM